MNVTPILCEIAEAHPSLGYRRVWAKVRSKGYNKSKATAYMEMKRGGLLVPKSSYRELKTAFEARKAYLVKPDDINRLYRPILPSSIYRGILQYLLLAMDYLSRYLLVLKLYPSMAA